METAIINGSTKGSGNSETSSTSAITLDGVMKDFTQWRSNKKSQPSIPDSLWASIFTLSEEIDAGKLRVLFGLNTKQYQKKWAQLRGNGGSSNASRLPEKKQASGTVPPADAFCEVTPLPLNGKPIKPVAFERPAHTYLVEFCRSDGRVMKIHATHQHLGDLMASFFGDDSDAPNHAKA